MNPVWTRARMPTYALSRRAAGRPYLALHIPSPPRRLVHAQRAPTRGRARRDAPRRRCPVARAVAGERQLRGRPGDLQLQPDLHRGPGQLRAHGLDGHGGRGEHRHRQPLGATFRPAEPRPEQHRPRRHRAVVRHVARVGVPAHVLAERRAVLDAHAQEPARHRGRHRAGVHLRRHAQLALGHAMARAIAGLHRERLQHHAPLRESRRQRVGACHRQRPGGADLGGCGLVERVDAVPRDAGSADGPRARHVLAGVRGSSTPRGVRRAGARAGAARRRRACRRAAHARVCTFRVGCPSRAVHRRAPRGGPHPVRRFTVLH